jgi:hypothetical protein
MADFRELRLTSPHMRGREVEVAEHRLHNNRYGEFYKPPHTDGVYGPEVADATKQAKYKLGFPGPHVDRHYDAALDARLANERPLGALYALRRRARQKPPKPKGGDVFAKALAIGLKQQGVHESPPGSNRVKYTAWYGVVGSWCAMFESWCFDQAGWAAWRYAYVPNILAAAYHHEDDMRVVNVEHARGCKTDLALWHFAPSDHYPNHVSFVLDINGSTVRSLDGNTNNDGEVAIRTRPESLVQHFVHVEH